MQQLDLFRNDDPIQERYSRHVAARLIEGNHETDLSGSLPIVKTIGTVEVAALAASAAGVVPIATITVTGCQAKSIARAPSRSF